MKTFYAKLKGAAILAYLMGQPAPQPRLTLVQSDHEPLSDSAKEKSRIAAVGEGARKFDAPESRAHKFMAVLPSPLPPPKLAKGAASTTVAIFVSVSSTDAPPIIKSRIMVAHRFRTIQKLQL